MPAGALYFTLEVNGAHIQQPLRDNVAAPVAEPEVPYAELAPPASPPGRGMSAPIAPSRTPPPVPPPIPAVHTVPPVAQPVRPAPAQTPPASPSAPVAAEKSGFDAEPKELEMDLSDMIDLEFEKSQGDKDAGLEKPKEP